MRDSVTSGQQAEDSLSDTGALLLEMTGRLLVERFDEAVLQEAESGRWPAPAWDAAVEQGLTLALVEGEEGFDIPPRDGLALIRLLGTHAIPLPLAETMIANAVLAQSGFALAEGPVALITPDANLKIEQDAGSWRISGGVDRVPWGRHAEALLVEHDGRVALLTSGFGVSHEGSNMASMPRDRMSINAVAETAPLLGPSLQETGALARALQMAGALETLLTLTVNHVSEREQFGRPLSKFQAVQHSLARLTGEVAAGSAAADLAADAFVNDDGNFGLALAAARARLGESAGNACAIAHQLHGAIGFTNEHRLHRFTTALWSWRDEFGSTSAWTRRLGAAALSFDKADYWPMVTAA